MQGDCDRGDSDACDVESGDDDDGDTDGSRDDCERGAAGDDIIDNGVDENDGDCNSNTHTFDDTPND